MVVFFQGRRQERHKRAVLWARCHTTVRRPSSSGLVEVQSSYPPGLLRCDGPKRRRRLAASLLGIVCRPVSFAAVDRGLWYVQSRRRRQQCASFSRGLDWYGRHKIRKSTQVMPSRIVSVPGSPNCSVGRSVLGGVCWKPGAGGGRYEPVDRLIDVDKLLDGDEEVQSVDRMHAKWRVSNSADEKKRFVLCPSPQTHSEPKSIGNVHRSVRGQPRLHSVGLE